MIQHRINDSDARPTIRFEQWEEGAHVPRIANARDYSFPTSLVIPYTWHSASRALSLSDALNHVSLHDERNPWGPATYIQPVPGVNYPNQPRSDSSSDLSDPLTCWWGATLCPPELNDVALAETVAIMMRYVALREVNLNTEVKKPSLADVLEFKGATMDCAIESTPSEETCIYTSVLEGGNLMLKFEDDDAQEMVKSEDTLKEQGYPIRASGEHATVGSPWPRVAEKENRDTTGATKRKPYLHRRQGNRWDQYGESSSGASSEAHIASDHVQSESTWGPCESAHRDERAAQPYRLQKANRGDGQWSRWASDIRQSQPDHESESSMWQSSAGDRQLVEESYGMGRITVVCPD